MKKNPVGTAGWLILLLSGGSAISLTLSLLTPITLVLIFLVLLAFGWICALRTRTESSSHPDSILKKFRG